MENLGPYIPIARPKEGELKALSELSDDARKRITPFFDFHRAAIVNKKRKHFNKHIEDTCKKIEKFWSNDNIFIFDLYMIDLELKMDDSTHPINWICNYFRENGFAFIPTIGTERDQNYLDALAFETVLGLDNGICIRLLKDDLETPEATSKTVNKILNKLEVSSGDVHLLIDFKFVAQADIINILS